jgi:uncharacterized RDD family membrane protein YckC
MPRCRRHVDAARAAKAQHPHCRIATQANSRLTIQKILPHNQAERDRSGMGDASASWNNNQGKAMSAEKQTLFFQQRYRGMDTDTLIAIQSRGDLGDIAAAVMDEVLRERGISGIDREHLARRFNPASYAMPHMLASLGDRLLARFLDIMTACAIAALAFLLARWLDGPEMIALVAWLAYMLFSDGFSGGQSLGKKLVSIAVMQKGSGNPGKYWQSVGRNIPWLVLAMLDWIFIFGESRRRLGDYLANTEVVKVSKA